MQQLMKEGLARHIGVSNFYQPHLDALNVGALNGPQQQEPSHMNNCHHPPFSATGCIWWQRRRVCKRDFH